jgi:hypothetical protein
MGGITAVNAYPSLKVEEIFSDVVSMGPHWDVISKTSQQFKSVQAEHPE